MHNLNKKYKLFVLKNEFFKQFYFFDNDKKMAKTIKVNLGGLDYTLTGDDEELVKNAAELVNHNMQKIKEHYKGELPSTTIQALVALNFAENEILADLKSNAENKLLAEQLAKMVEYLENTIKN